MSVSLFEYVTDAFLKKCLDNFLACTKSAERESRTFSQLIEANFKNLSEETYKVAFKETDKNKIDDNKWFAATTKCFKLLKYTTYSNIGAIYVSTYTDTFADENEPTLRQEFVRKFCLENNIRNSILNKILGYEGIDRDTVGSMLSGALSEEEKLVAEEKAKAEIIFEVYSREEAYYENLPELLDGKYYNFVVEPGKGVGYVTDNKITYIPPTVNSITLIPACIMVLTRDGFIESRTYVNIKVKPVKYLAPVFKTYKVEQGTSIELNLGVVDENYHYIASVPKGFGEVKVDGYMLTYTAPITSLTQNVGVYLALIWNNTTTVFNTTINFRVQIDNIDVDSSEGDDFIANIKNTLSKQNEAIIAQNNRLDSAEQDSIVNKEKIGKLLEEVTSITNNINSIDTKVTSQNDAITKNTNKIENINRDLDSAKFKIEQNEIDIEILRESLGGF